MPDCWTRLGLEYHVDDDGGGGLGETYYRVVKETPGVKTGFIMMILLGGLTSALAIKSIMLHLKHYSQYEYQRYIVRLLFLIPMIVILILMEYQINSWAIGLEVIRNLLISVGIVDLLKWMMNILGSEGEHELKGIFRHRKPCKMAFPLNFISYKPSNKYHLPLLRVITHQAAILLPLLSLISLISQTTSHECPFESHLHTTKTILSSLMVVSSLLSMYAVINFYHLSQLDFRSEVGYVKLLSILTLLYAPSLQSIMVDSLIPIGTLDDGFRLTKPALSVKVNNLVTSIILTLISVGLYTTLDYNRYQSWEPKQTKMLPGLWDVGNLSEIPKEILFGFQCLLNPNLLTSSSYGPHITAASFRHSFQLSFKNSRYSTIKDPNHHSLNSEFFKEKLPPPLNLIPTPLPYQNPYQPAPPPPLPQTTTPINLIHLPHAAHLRELRHHSVQQLNYEFDQALLKVEPTHPDPYGFHHLNDSEDRRHHMDFAPHSRGITASHDTLRNLSSMSSLNFNLPPSQLRKYQPPSTASSSSTASPTPSRPASPPPDLWADSDYHHPILPPNSRSRPRP